MPRHPSHVAFAVEQFRSRGVEIIAVTRSKRFKIHYVGLDGHPHVLAIAIRADRNITRRLAGIIKRAAVRQSEVSTPGADQ
jgi:hypothetical protein